MPRQRRSRIITVLILTIVAAVGGGVLYLVVPVVKPFGQAVLHQIRIESQLQQPEVYEPVAQTLALYCQSDPALFPRMMSSAWFPKELNDVAEGRARIIDPTHAYIEFGGGFYHFGYSVKLDEKASTPNTNVWHLSYYRESGKNRLHTLELDKSGALTAHEIVERVSAGYDRQLQSDPASVPAYQGKIALYLRHDRVEEARQTVREMLTALPNNRWAALAIALITDVIGTPNEAEATFVDWIEQDPDFVRYLDLAYFYQLTNQPEKAASAIITATQFDANRDFDWNVSWRCGGKPEFRAYTVAAYAYRSAEFDAVVQLCEKMLAGEKHTHAAWRELRQAALNASRNKVDDFVWSNQMPPFEPFMNADIEKLLGRKVERPTMEEYKVRNGLPLSYDPEFYYAVDEEHQDDEDENK